MSEQKRFLFLDTENPQGGEFAQLLHLISSQNGARKNFEPTESPETLAHFINEESHELIDSIEHDKPAIEVTSEIGDILFLTLKLCSQLGIDPRDALEMKILRNALKYNDMSNSTGDYHNGRNQSKKIWQGMGGDEQFYRMYEELFDHDEEEIQQSLEQSGVIFTQP